MKYIIHRTFETNAICGDVNLPVATICDSDRGLIFYQGKPLCLAGSENAHQYFAINDDGMGLIRGKLTQAIQNTLAEQDDDYQKRWDKVWEDEVCQPFKRKEHVDFWLWNQAFFDADIDTLRYIANLVGVKEEI